jgi:hypothetical protein
MVRYLAALGIDAFATSMLAVVALAHGGPGMIGLALVAAAGLWLAVAATSGVPSGSTRRARGLLVGGLLLNTSGSIAIGVASLVATCAQGTGEVPPTTGGPLAPITALALLVVGDVLSVVYLRIMAAHRYAS